MTVHTPPSILSLVRMGSAAFVIATGFATADAGAQSPPKVARIGFLGMDSRMQAERVIAFRKELRERGYVEGRDVIIEYRWAEGQFDRLSSLAAELAALQVDVIVTAAPTAVRAAQRATTSIPIVMSVHDPIGMGIVKGFANPGGNITGMAFQDSALSTKRLDLLRQAVPKLTRVAILWNKEGGSDAALRAVEHAGADMGVQTLALELPDVAAFGPAIARASAWGAQGVVQLASPYFTKHRQVLLAELKAHRLPATCELREYVVDGCLMTYSANINAMFARLAYFVDRILKGVPPANLPLEQPREFEFVINHRTAQSLGLTIPSSLRLQANEIVP